MFLLIDEAIAVVYDDSNFNTSHVSINQDTENGSAPAGVISIHLMFLLIGFSCSSVFSFLHYFNTSHVSINLSSDRHACVVLYHFNTSHVSINRIPGSTGRPAKKFQYISCFY